MARIVYIIGTLKGSIGGITFQGNNSGYIVRQKPTLHKSSTVKQTNAHSQLQTYLYRWQQITETNRMNWNVFAGLNPKTNKFGAVKTLTGLNYFFSCNYMRTLMGQTQLDDPPSYDLPDAAPTFSVNADTGSLQLIDLDTYDYTNNAIIIWTTLPTRRNTLTNNQIRKYVEIITANPGSPFSISDEWQDATKIDYDPIALFPGAMLNICIEPVRVSSGITGTLRCVQTQCPGSI
jgi:hypothetical protein